MKQNLDELKTEILAQLEASQFTVFFGYSRIMDDLPVIFWDADRYPDYKQFLAVARASDVKLIVLNTREFASSFIDNAMAKLKESDLTREERRPIESRLREMRSYDGFTCSIEITFDIQGRTYMFGTRTDWWVEFSDLVEEIESSFPDDEMDDEDDDDPSLGHYFSKN